MSLNATLKRNLLDSSRIKDLPPYFPHLSLVYGDLKDEEKQAIINRLDTTGQLLPPATIAGLKGIKPIEVLLVRTSGKSSEWKVLGKVRIEDGEITLIDT